jgi:Bcr/CflA subfamily drug resistance transporter
MKRTPASPPSLATLVLLAAVSTLTLNLFLPSLAGMAEELRTDYALVSLSISGYLAVTAVLQMVMGPLSDRFGRRPVLLAGLAIFVVGSLGCALATDIWTFLGFRVLQGAVISGWVLSLAVIRDTAPAQKSAGLIGYVSMAMAVAPMLGPMLGGVLDGLFGWRSNFFVLTALGAVLLLLCWFHLGETNTNPVGTFARQVRAYPELFGSTRFWGYVSCMAFSRGAFYAFLSGAPLVAQTALDLPTSALGFYMGSITGGFFLGSFIAARCASRYSLSTMMIAGRLVACVGLCLGLALFLAGIVNEASFFGATLCIGIGNGLTMPSSDAGALSVRPGLAGTASGLASALTGGAGALIAWVTGEILTEENAVYELVAVMLFCSAAGLASALLVRRLDRPT